MKVRLDPVAAAYLKRLDRVTRDRISSRIDQLGESPFDHSKPLEGGNGLRSSRVGDYRMILRITDDDEITVLVLKIAPRGEVYRRLPIK